MASVCVGERERERARACARTRARVCVHIYACIFSMCIYCKYIPAGSSFSFYAPNDVLMEKGAVHTEYTPQNYEKKEKGVEVLRGVNADVEEHEEYTSAHVFFVIYNQICRDTQTNLQTPSAERNLRENAREMERK